MTLREHLPSIASPYPPRHALLYLRCERVPLGPRGPLSGPPLTWVVAEKRHEHDRTIYYVRVDTWRVDGWSRSLARKRYRSAVIVDAQSLGPLPSVRRRRKPTAEQRVYLDQWRAYYRRTWQQMLERDAPCDLLRRRWWECWPRPLPAAVMMRSELAITWLSQPCAIYVGEALLHPTVPNDINSHSLGDMREIVAYATICPVVQADAGLERWCQRVWYLDHSRRGFGLDPLDNWRGIVDPSSLCAGLPSAKFDRRKLVPATHQQRHSIEYLREQFLR